MTDTFHQRRTSFGARAAEYDRVRPSYPPSALAPLIGHLPSRVLDLGSGTGRLAASCAAVGATTVAVEPDAAMARVAAGHLVGTVVRGVAERIPLTDGSMDAIVAGQAWHWFDHGAATTECARILRRGGRIGILRNLRDESEPWVGALGEIIGGEDRSVATFFGATTIDLGAGFGPVAMSRIAHTHRIATADLVTLAATHSYVAVHPERERMLADVRTLTETHPALAGRSELDIPYLCDVFSAVRS
ncbi:MAG: class I SAM-dependent methyltransferase [Acidimicrobiales bacterium]